MTSFGQQNQNRNMGRQPQRLLSETARCLTRAYGTHSTQCTSITIDQTLQTEIRLSAASSVNKQACSCETPAKKAPTKPDNRLCPSTKVQLGKQEWLALANVRKTTCKFSQHKMDPKHRTKPLLRRNSHNFGSKIPGNKEKRWQNQSFLCLVPPRRSSTKRIEMNDAANVQRSFRICL